MQHDLDSEIGVAEFVNGANTVGGLGGISQEGKSEQQGRLWWSRKPSPTIWRLILMVGDSVLLIASFELILVVAPLFHLDLRISWDDPETWRLKLLWAAIALISWSFAVSATRAQDLLYASSRFKSPLKALSALVLMLISWIVITYPFIASRVSSYIGVLLLFLLVAAPSLSIWRVSLTEFMNLPRFRQRGVIVGVTAAGQTIARELRNMKRPNVNILGYISGSDGEPAQKDGLPILGDRGTLRHLAHSGMIDMIIMAVDYKAYPDLFQVAIEVAQLNISVVPMAMAYERTTGRIPVEHVGDQWYLSLPSERAVSPLYLCWQKLMDISFGICGMVILLLILPVLALVIYLDSPGPIFYSQERLGYQGRKFSIYKFRSMHPNAERKGATWAVEGDTRVTRVGRFMRALHLDELPQVFNILRSDMSLIGPRPEREEFVVDLEKTIPFYRCRLIAKPGLTGWAQVKYSYTSTERDVLIKLQHDLYYIKHQSFTLDIFIILKTVIEVLFCRGT